MTFVQQKHLGIVGIHSHIESVLATLNDHRTKNPPDSYGRFELQFYRDAFCYFNDAGKITSRTCNDHISYGKSFEVHYKNAILKDNDNTPRGTHFRENLLQKLEDQLIEYFPQN